MKNMKVIIALLLSATGAAAFSTGAKAATIGLGFATPLIPGRPDEIFAPAAMTFPVKDAPLKRRLEETNQYKLIKSGAECKSDDADLGSFSTEKGCADKCAQTEGCRYFIYGIAGSKTRKCFHEKTSEATCSEGWESDSYNFYELSTAILIKSGAECKSDDAFLGSFGTVKGCADKCAQTDGCRYFIYGIYGDGGVPTPTGGDKTGECYHEKTSDATCSEGWDSDSYDFYESIAATTKATEAEPKYATAAERAECLADGGSCDECCKGIACQVLEYSGTYHGSGYYDLNFLTLSDNDDCVILLANYNKVDATSPRLKRPWLFFASARRVGKRRRRCDRRRRLRKPPLRQRLPRPSGIPTRRRLVRARGARRWRRRFAHA